MSSGLLLALSQPGKRDAVVRDCERVLDAEVHDKGGLSGLAVKGAFAMVKKLQPDFVPRAVDGLLDDFVRAVEPFYDRWKANPAGQKLSQYFVANGSAISDALLAITDERARKNKHGTVVSAYGKLRPKGKEHVMAAMKRVGELFERHSAGG